MLPSGGNDSLAAGQPSSHEFEIYKLKYQRCGQRYEDVYKAIWTNFSYMAVISGAILSFGGDRFEMALTVFLACLPLLFWFWATFEPLNRYGDQVVTRLSEIEKILNQNYFSSSTQSQGQPRRGLHHFTDFEESREEKQYRVLVLILLGLVGVVIFMLVSQDLRWKICFAFLLFLLFIGMICSMPKELIRKLEIIKKWIPQQLRVRNVIRSFVLVVHLIAIFFGFRIFWQLLPDQQSLVRQKGSEVKLSAVGESGEVRFIMDLQQLEALLQRNLAAEAKIGSIEKTIKDIQNDLRKLLQGDPTGSKPVTGAGN
jgi:exosortase/archaeosortase